MSPAPHDAVTDPERSMPFAAKNFFNSSMDFIRPGEGDSGSWRRALKGMLVDFGMWPRSTPADDTKDHGN